MKYKWLLLIILLASFLRLWKLGELPRDAHVDEVMNAYIGKFTIQNGTDLYGNKWPVLYFDNFGDYPNILPMYLSGIGAVLFGNNELGFRLPIAFFGIISVWLVYLIAKIIFRQENLALFAAFTLAVFPWHIVLSRATAEGITAAAVFLLGLYLLLRYIGSNFLFPLFISLILLLLTYLLYASYRVIVPLVLLPTFLLAKNKKGKIFCLVAFVISFALTFAISQTIWGTGRFEQTSLFSQQSPVYPMQAEFIMGEGFDNAFKARLLYNKAIMFGKEFFKQYASYFSVDFLFVKGGLPMRYYVPDQGVWYYSYLLLFLAFIATALINGKYFAKFLDLALPTANQKKYFFYIFYLLLLAPLSAALTIDDTPNVHRAALMPILFSILAGLPFLLLKYLPYKKILSIGFIALISFESFYFFNKYEVHADKFEQVYRSPAMKNLSAYLASEKSQFDDIFIERKGETAVYYLFYNQIFDQKLNTEFQRKLQIPQVGNIHFTEHECVYPGLIKEDLSKKKSLFIISSSCFKDRPQILQLYPQLQEVGQVRSAQGDVIFRTYQLEATESATKSQ